MKRFRLLTAFAIVTAVAMFGLTATVQAHHSFAAEFDRNRPVQLHGTVTKVEWTNPHVWIYFNSKDAAGKTTNWGLSFSRARFTARLAVNLKGLVKQMGAMHYALARDFEIAVVDAARGFGNGCRLPAGPLREPVVRRPIGLVTLRGKSLSPAAAAMVALLREAMVALAPP